MTSTIWGTTTKPVAAEQLVKIVEREFPGEGFLYVGYPVLSTADGASSIDALWVSPTRGVIVFHLLENKDVEGFEEIQDEFGNSLEPKLRNHEALMKQRELLAAPIVISYGPRVNSVITDGDYLLTNDATLPNVIRNIHWSYPQLFEVAHSVVQSISSIRKGRRRRALGASGTRGSKLKALEDSVANLDSLQSRAVIETVEGVQRIRDLAGSGKTIILALKAAYLHAQRPEWRIAITFNTRSLKEQFKRLIETFVAEQTGEPPIWEKINIIHAWGAPGGANRLGLYYEFCVQNGVEFLDFQTARSRFIQNEFGNACELALAQVETPTKLYDLILVDEAQDFDPAFLRMCYASLGNVKRLVYAYDELQSLNENSLPPPEEVFGRRSDGSPNVEFALPSIGRP